MPLAHDIDPYTNFCRACGKPVTEMMENDAWECEPQPGVVFFDHERAKRWGGQLVKAVLALMGLLLALGFPGLAWAQVGCDPNPNINGPPFVDGCTVPAAGLNKISSAAVSGYAGKNFGADTTGATDATSAVQTCLNTVGAGASCIIDPGAKILLLGSLTIPARTTLTCGQTFGDSEATLSAVQSFATAPALRLDGGHTISAAGPSATLSNCLIWRNGMTFPASDSTSYTGTAVSDAGNENFALTNDVILGFNTCFYYTGPRPYIDRVYADCSGSGTLAAAELDTGNTDSGYIDKVKLQPIARIGGSTCTALVTPGTGMRISGSGGNGYFVGNIVVQDFTVLNVDVVQPFLLSGTLVVDGLGTVCGFGSSIGIKVGSSGLIAGGGQLNINQVNTGLYILSPNTTSVALINESNLGGDGILLSGTTPTLYASQITEGNIAGYAIHVTVASPDFHTDTALLVGIHSAAAPYIKADVAIGLGCNYNLFCINHLVTDKLYGTVIYDTTNFLLGEGSERMVGGFPATITSCTGAGSTGTCTFEPGSDMIQGVISINSAGTGQASTGQVSLTQPMGSRNFTMCQFTLASGSVYPSSGSWQSTATLGQVVNNSAFTSTVTWTNASTTLAASTDYPIMYACRYI